MLRRLALAVIKLVHTLAWFSIESCMLYVLWAGFRRQSDRRAAVAAGVVATETLIFTANRFQCPLTQIAERVGAEQGSVTDIYLPRWFADNLPAIHVPLIVLAGYLHGRNASRARRVDQAAPAAVGQPGWQAARIAAPSSLMWSQLVALPIAMRPSCSSGYMRIELKNPPPPPRCSQ